jgi:membrane-associated protease RseP (regulator of RpoE activity)
MNWDLISIIIFYGLLFLLFKKYRSRFTVQNRVFALFKTKLGLKAMDRIAKAFPRLIKWLGYIGVIVGFGGMIFIFVFLVKETAKFILAPALSFWHWVIAIFVVAVVHEFSHGVLARRYKIKIKSSGFAFLGPILAAFVEPNEKQLSSAKKWRQLSVLSAGPFSNIILGILFLLLLQFVLGPWQLSLFAPAGIIVGTTMDGYPMAATDIQAPFVITSLNGKPTPDFASFVKVTMDIKPGDKAILVTDKGNYTLETVQNPENSSKAFMGVTNFKQKLSPKSGLEGYGKLPFVMMWINLLVLWLFVINLGVGLFNLLPIGPVDGGKMFFIASTHFLKSEEKAKKAWTFVSFACLALIVINLLPWVWKLLVWMFKALLFLIAFI